VNAGKETEKMDAGSLAKALKKEFGAGVSGIRTDETVHGKSNSRAQRLWVTVKPGDYKKVVAFLFELQAFPHYCVSSGYDAGKEIDIISHFAMNYAKPNGLVLLNIKTSLPKKKPEMDSITGMIPGAWVSEKEKQEFLGIKVKGIEPGRLFLDDSLPKGVYPWRKDSKGPGKTAINLHSGEKVE